MAIDPKIINMYNNLIDEISIFVKSDQNLSFDLNSKLTVNDYITIDKRINRNAVIKTDPIDLLYKNEIKETKKTFENVKNGQSLDISSIESFIDTALPDITGNNNILSRIRQLKEDDDYTYRHSLNVSILATNIGKWLGYSAKQLKELGTAALLFDIGKLTIPSEILNRPHKVTSKESKIIQQHTVTGYNMLKLLNLPDSILLAVLQHHENMDGSGYPLGVSGDKIHEFAKIIHICDMYDAMTTDRIYAPKKSPFEVADLIRIESGSKLDPGIAYIFLNNIAEFYSGSKVILNNGQTGTIRHINPLNPTSITLQIGEKFLDLSKSPQLKIVDFI
ncbi:MAG: HD-GYP domain-containing protein [Tissierellales bacterium]|jgi:putative nucleotidyltransferase with HDIG domain|nr:HD-GYP domain-containing protein [Tissierellales bacterium]